MQTMIDRRGLLKAAGVLGGTVLAGDLLALIAAAGTRSDTLRVAVDRDFESLRPDIWAGDTNHILKRLIYTTPILWGTKLRADGTLMYVTEEIELVLATSYRISDDRQTIEFTLRRDAKFANGDLITAQAVKASYDWHLDNGGPGSGQLKVNGLPSKDRIEAYENAEAQRLGNEAITMPIGSAERNEKLRRFQQLVCDDLGVIPLFLQFDTYAMLDRVINFVY